MPQLEKGTTYSPTNPIVTIDNLNAHVENAKLTSGAISEQQAIGGAANPASDQILLLNGGNLRKATVVQALGNITPSELLNRNNNLSELTNATTARSNLGLSNVENKSSETIRSEITLANVTSALAYLPTSPATLSTGLDSRIATSQQSSFATTAQLSALSSSSLSTFIATSQLGAINGVAQLGADGKLVSNQVAALTTASQLALLGTTALPVIGAQALLPVPLPVTRGGTGTQSSTGQGSVVLQDYAQLYWPEIGNAQIAYSTLSNVDIGTPTAGNLSNCTNLPVGSITGTLSVANGGTGQTTYANGQLLIGNGTGLTKATLTAGANVSITNASGSITVASSVPAATSSQIGGITPGPGFSISSGQLNAILPKAIASFSGKFADTINVSSIFSRTAGQNLITISNTNIVTTEKIKVGHRIYFTFVIGTGTNVPVAGIYTVASIIDNNSFSVSGGALTTAATGSANFKKCLFNFSEEIDSVVYAGTAAETGSYICNLSKNFSNKAYIPNVSVSQLGAASGTASFLDVYIYSLDECGGALERTTNSFGFETYNVSAIRDCGYYSGIVVFGNY